MNQPGVPKFIHSRCDSTGWCITVCPTDCLEMWNDRPYLKFAQACVSCGACVHVCPTQAVRIDAVSLTNRQVKV